MGLTILYGSSVSVKNEILYDRILREAKDHPERSYVILVPEQASLYTQEEMIRRAKNHALMNIDVLTFNRLAYRIFRETGEKERSMIDDTGKMMLLRLTVRELEDELLVLRRNLHRTGFLDELKSLFSEFAEYNITPEKLTESEGVLGDHPGLQKKLHEISRLYGAFLKRLHQNYEMAEERLAHLARCIPAWESAGNTVFAMTGFTGFTPPQEAVLSALLVRSPELFLTADLGSGEEISDGQEEDSLFHMSYVMCSRLKEAAIRHSLPVREEYIRETGAVSELIRKTEAGLYRWPPVTFPGKAEGLRLLVAPSPAEEVRALFSSIMEKLRDGARLREMAVIAGDPARYHDDIAEKAEELKLRVFFDETRSMTEDPLLQLISEVLAVFSEDYSYESVTALLKNPLVVRYIAGVLPPDEEGGTAYERICEFENFCLARGVRGKSRYEKAFTGRYRRFFEGRLPAINEVRKAAMEPVFSLHEGIRGRNASVHERLEALRKYLEDVGAEDGMNALAGEVSEPDKRREYERSYALVEEFLDKTDALLGAERLNYDSFSEALLSGLGSLHMGLVPPTKDELLVGDLLRTRLQGVRFLFVIGANDGVLPKPQEEGGLLSEADRELLAGMNIALSPTAREENFSAQFYLYRLFTGAGETLTVSWASSDADGRGLQPSPAVRKLQALFPEAETKLAGREDRESEEDFLSELSAPQEGLLFAAERIREAVSDEKREALSGAAYTLSKLLLLEEETKDAMDKVLRAAVFRYEPERLTEDTAARLFGTSVQESVSRLERFSSCPFLHFLDYGLKLEERPEYTVETADLGTMLHDGINSFFVLLKEENIPLSALSDEKRRELTEKAVREVTENYGEGLMADSAKNRYLAVRIARLIERTAVTLKEQWEAGDYDKSGTEVPFGIGAEMPAVRLDTRSGRTIYLQGRIDRMDFTEKNGRVYVKIIDYKSGKKEVEYTRVYYGLQLQLLLYLEAAKLGLKKAHPGREIVPAGIYYYHIDDPMVEAADEEAAEEEIRKKLQLVGVTNADPDAAVLIDRDFAVSPSVVHGLRLKKDGSFYSTASVASPEEMQKLGAFARKKASEIAEELQHGEIRVQPYEYSQESACTYCDNRNICGFDPRLPGYRARRLQKKTLQDLTEEIPSEEAPTGDHE